MSRKLFSLVVMFLLLSAGLSACIHIGDSADSPITSGFTQKPISTQVVNPLAVLTETPFSPASGSSYQVTLTNQSSHDVCFVYIALSTESTWGDDWLGNNEVVTTGGSRSFSVQPDTYDMRAEDCDYMRLSEQMDVTISDNYAWQADDSGQIFSEDFNGDTTRWIRPSTASGKGVFADGVLNLSAAQKNTLAVESYPLPVQDSIAVVEATPLQNNSDGSTAFGLMCRVQPDGDGYLFMARDNTQFTIQKISGSKWIPLADWQPDPSVSFDNADVNVLQVTCNGRALALRFNGITLLKATDDAFKSGNTGLAALTFSDSKASFKFDNLAVIQP